MKRILKEIKNKVSTVWLCILSAVCIIPFCIFMVLNIPVDYIRYKRSPYYKNEGKKYKLFDGMKDVFKLYNEIAKNELPIEYIANPKDDSLSSGMFAYNGILLIPDLYYNFTYNPQEEKWGWWGETEDENEEIGLIMGLDAFIDEEIHSANTAIGKEICTRGVLVTWEGDIENNLEEARKEPLFLLYDNNRVEALKRFCRENA